MRACPVWADGAGAGGSKAAKAPSVKLPGPAFVALETITPEHIRWHVRYLSHDLLEGRGTGQRGGDIAAEYIATQFAEYGLKPAGDNGTYMQKVPLVGITTLPETQFSLVPKQGETMNLKPLDEYVAYDQTQQAQSDVDADIVFVGYGIEAPEYNWDDYKGRRRARQSAADAGERAAFGRSEIFQGQGADLLRALDLQV